MMMLHPRSHNSSSDKATYTGLRASGLAVLLSLSPLTAGAHAPQLLIGDDTALITLIAVALLPFVLAPLFSIIYFFSRRDACKWLAIGLTAFLLIIEQWIADAFLVDWGAIISALSVALITTKLWMRASPKRYAFFSLLWGVGMLRLTAALFGILMRFLPYSLTMSQYIWPIAWNGIMAAMLVLIGVQILKGTRQRGLGLPSLVEFGGYSVLLVLSDIALDIVPGLLKYLVSMDRYGSHSYDMINYNYAAVRAGVGAAAAVAAWYWYRRQSANEGNA